MSQAFSPDIPAASISDTKQGAIISPLIDFLMVGGLSFLLLALACLPVFRSLPGQAVYVVTLGLAFVVNYPHFMHSYQLLYEGFGAKLRDRKLPVASRARLVIAGIVAPVLIALFLIYGAMQESQQVIGYGTIVMVFLVGWHYVKQGYGILIVLAARKKLYIGPGQKRILLLNAYIAWIYLWAAINKLFLYHAQVAPDAKRDYLGIAYSGAPIPDWILTLFLALVFFSSIAVIFVFIQIYRQNRAFSVNGAVAYCAPIYLWLAGNIMFQGMHYLAFIPMLHSLQYLPFAWKMAYEKTRARPQEADGGKAEDIRQYALKRLGSFIGVGIVAGAASFHAIPWALDTFIPYNTDIFGATLFMFCIFIFINVHHYFIDFAIWRRDNPDMKYLFK